MMTAATPPGASEQRTTSPFRRAAHESVRTLFWVGILVFVYTVLNAVVPPMADPRLLIGNLIIAGTLIVSGRLLGHRDAGPTFVSWAFASAITVLVIWLLFIYWVDPVDPKLVYVAIAMTAFGSLTSAWRPFIVAGIVMLAGAVATFAYVGNDETASWMIGISSALAVSAVLLRQRMRSLTRLAESQREILEVSTRDLLTGALNRHGLQDRITAVWTDAERRQEAVTVYFLDIRGLKQANDRLGHDTGDRILTDAAAAITTSVRASDLVVRWGGDEFVVVSVGQALPCDEFSDRVNAAFTSRSPERRDDAIGPISVGRASAPASTADFEHLERDADADMYARRARQTPTA